MYDEYSTVGLNSLRITSSTFIPG